MVKDLRHLPSTKAAVLEAEFALLTARAKGIRLIKFLHDSDRVSLLVRRQIRVRKREGKVDFLIAGEKFKECDIRTEYLLNKYPEEAADEDLGKQNKNITIAGLL
ncbi:MAG: hypothetical protein J6K61_06350 [Clostridia bacterium]|nr:hypothetical protein [Clostridia bacterium]